MRKHKVPIYIAVDSEFKDKLRRLSLKERRTMTDLIIMAVEKVYT